MTRRWVKERKSEYYYRKAKQMEYRSRASFKLKQIQQKFDVLKRGGVVVDLGAAPGGWLQVAKEEVGPKGVVVGVDLQPIAPLEGVITLRGDITKKETVDSLLEALKGRRADAVISDMSPNISGNYSMDHARSVDLCRHALSFGGQVLVEGGNMVMKIFDGDMTKDFLEEVRRRFDYVKLHSPKASRSSSSEIYIVAKGFKSA
jgi:23S rRNA (uridine2552-2'-O)-methyltransferase